MATRLASPPPAAVVPDNPSRPLMLVLAGLLLTLLLAALDQTIVGTALPSLAADLHAFDHYAWVTTAYLLTSTVGVPIAGKLTDQFGRKPFLLGGAAFFVATSALCALASSLGLLVAARALQGVGAGVVTAAAFAAVPSLFAPRDRGRVVGLFTGTYGLASILGPLLGGAITDLVGWRGVFFINLPLGALAMALVWATYPAQPRPEQRPRVDVPGAVLLVGGVTPLLLALSLGGHELAWTSPGLPGLLVLGGLLLAAFVWVERRSAEPIVPLRLVGGRRLGVPTLGMGLLAMAMFGATLFTPLFVQGVIGQSATRSGSVLAPLMLAFVLGSVAMGQVLGRLSAYRLPALAGLALAALGLLLMAGMGPDTTYPVVARNLALTGLGLGCALTAFAVAAQNAVAVALMGVATALGTFARALGNAFSSALLGGLLSARLPVGADHLPVDALAAGLHQVFLVAAGLALIGALLSLWLPRPLLDRPLPAPH